jgi:hypothetical protein
MIMLLLRCVQPYFRSVGIHGEAMSTDAEKMRPSAWPLKPLAKYGGIC